jgi:hypothetical protein
LETFFRTGEIEGVIFQTLEKMPKIYSKVWKNIAAPRSAVYLGILMRRTLWCGAGFD